MDLHNAYFEQFALLKLSMEISAPARRRFGFSAIRSTFAKHMARSLELGTLGKNPAAFQDFFWKKKFWSDRSFFGHTVDQSDIFAKLIRISSFSTRPTLI